MDKPSGKQIAEIVIVSLGIIKSLLIIFFMQ